MKHSHSNSSTVSKENEGKPEQPERKGLLILFEAGYIKILQMSNP